FFVRIVDVCRDLAPGFEHVGVVVLRPRVEVDAAAASASTAAAAAAAASATTAAAAAAAAACQEGRTGCGPSGEPEEAPATQRRGDPVRGLPRDQDAGGFFVARHGVLLLWVLCAGGYDVVDRVGCQHEADLFIGEELDEVGGPGAPRRLTRVEPRRAVAGQS